jgi:hypothetical protein
VTYKVQKIICRFLDGLLPVMLNSGLPVCLPHCSVPISRQMYKNSDTPARVTPIGTELIMALRPGYLVLSWRRGPEMSPLRVPRTTDFTPMPPCFVNRSVSFPNSRYYTSYFPLTGGRRWHGHAPIQISYQSMTSNIG